MAFILVKDPNDTGYERLAKTAESVMAVGDVLAWDVTNNALERATSSSTTLTIYGVCMEVKAAADTDVLVMPFHNNQTWQCETASATATTQIGERATLTDHDTLNNTSTDVTTTSGMFRIVDVVGATSDNKALVKPMLGVVSA